MEPDGNLKLYLQTPSSFFVDFFNDICRLHNYCGPYGICANPGARCTCPAAESQLLPLSLCNSIGFVSQAYQLLIPQFYERGRTIRREIAPIRLKETASIVCRGGIHPRVAVKMNIAMTGNLKSECVEEELVMM